MVLRLGLVLCIGLVFVHGDKQISSNLLKSLLGGLQDDYYDTAKGLTYNIVFSPPDTSIQCPEGRPSFQPHPADATKFLLCREGKVYYMFQCIPGYVFKLSDRTCVYLPGSLITEAPNMKTSEHPIPYQETPVPQTPAPHEQTPQPKAKTPVPIQETPKPPVFAFTDPPVSGFSLPQGQATIRPVYHAYRQATGNPCQSAVASNQFYYPHPTDRTKYIQCDQFGDAFVKTCPENKYWHQQVLQCIKDGLFMGGTLIG